LESTFFVHSIKFVKAVEKQLKVAVADL